MNLYVQLSSLSRDNYNGGHLPAARTTLLVIPIALALVVYYASLQQILDCPVIYQLYFSELRIPWGKGWASAGEPLPRVFLFLRFGWG